MECIQSIKGIANVQKSFSTCAKHQVGAVIFDEDGAILATGYNGTINGMSKCNELFNRNTHGTHFIHEQVQDWIQFEYISDEGDGWFFVTRDEWDRVHRIFAHKYEVHAEQDAIYHLLKTGNQAHEMFMYSTLEPCDQCAKAICAVGFKAVYVEERHKACHILADRTIYMED